MITIVTNWNGSEEVISDNTPPTIHEIINSVNPIMRQFKRSITAIMFSIPNIPLAMDNGIAESG